MNGKDSPFYLRFGLTVLTIATLAIAVYYGRGILLPLFFSILLATLLLPLVKLLQRIGLGKVVAISVTLAVSIIFIGSIVYFLSTQIGVFLEDFPTIEKRARQFLWTAQEWIREHLKIGFKAQKEYLDETAEQMKQDGGGLVQRTFLTLTGVISYVVFVPTYTFLILYHKDMIKRFLIEVFSRQDRDRVRDVISESQVISQKYITGLVIELLIVFTLNTVGFLYAGIQYPVFLALVGALLNIVPYIGMIIANILCISITFVASSNPTNAIWVAVVLATVQLIDNNLLMPLIVGNRVKLNALAIILGVLVAGAVAGVAGMFLAIPSLAVLKVIFERVEHLQPWALLLGDETTIEEEKKNPVKRTFHRLHRTRAGRSGKVRSK